MKKLSCKDMGVADCDFVAEGETAEEAVQKSKEHAMAAHKEKIDEMASKMSPEEMDAMMMSKVTDM